MDFTNAIEILKQSYSMIQPAIPSVVAALMATVFVRKNTQKQELEKLKQGKFNEVANDLLENGQITHLEYYKCSNFLDIAQKADDYYKNRPKTNKEKASYEGFDFDWFMRFYDSVGNINNASMQDLWAKVLAGEVHNSGSFSLRTLETLRNLNIEEARLFKRITSLVLTEKSGLRFVMCTLNDLGQDINEAYGIGKNEFYILEECGLLNSVRNDSRISLSEKPAGFWNDKVYLELKYKRNDSAINSYKYSSYALTQSALQLLPVVAQEQDASYLLDIGRELMKRYSGNLRVCAYRKIDLDCIDFDYDESQDLLSKDAKISSEDTP